MAVDAQRASTSSLRTRLTILAVVVVGMALLVSAVALVTIVRREAQNSVSSAARLRAQDFVALLASGTSPAELHLRLEEDEVVQILDGDGGVAAASPTIEGRPPLVTVAGSDAVTVEGVPGEEDDSFLVVAAGAETEAGPATVLVGRNLDTVRETTGVIVIVLLVTIPLLLGIVALTSWKLVGRALEPVEAMRREQQRLVSDASHELRNPVAAIRQYAEVALAHPEQTDAAQLAREVLNEDLRLQRIAEDLLLLARSDEGALEPTTRPLDLDDLVLEEVERLKHTTDLSVDGTGISAGRVVGDETMLRRLVRNLSDNAVRHASSLVALGVAERDGEVILTIDDDGPGITGTDRAAVFERFTRLDEARSRDDGGAGLGLAIVAEIATAHGGSVSVSDAPIGGARFLAVFPRAGT